MPAPISGEKIDEIATLKDRKDLSSREKAERLGVTHPLVLKYERMMEEMGISTTYLSMFNDKEKQLLFNPDYGKRKSHLADIDAEFYLHIPMHRDRLILSKPIT